MDVRDSALQVHGVEGWGRALERREWREASAAESVVVCSNTVLRGAVVAAAAERHGGAGVVYVASTRPGSEPSEVIRLLTL